MMQYFTHRNCGAEFGSMGFRYDHDSGIAAVFVDSDHLVGGTERKSLAERTNRRLDRRGAHVGPHHLANVEVANPADIRRAPDGFAAQVETPGGKRVSEE